MTLAALLVALSPSAARAQSPPPEAARACAGLQDNGARLSCYDNVLGRVPSGAAAGDNAVAGDNVAAVAGEVPVPEDEISLLDSRWELDRYSKRGLFQMRPYKPVYLSPYSWMSDRNTTPHTPKSQTSVSEPQDLDSVEAKFQISLKFKLAENLFKAGADLWGAYTQSSRWQVYNSENSRPFRETDYEPELILVVPVRFDVLGWRGRMAGVGLNHQSNGRADPLSRSWNRVVFLVGLDRENWAMTIRPWRRIKESAGDDDNPDIADYLGRCDVTLVHTWKMHQFSLMGRHSLHDGDRSHGALQLEWGFPIHGFLRGRVQIFHGYGESMIDYNFKATWVNLGFSLVEWF